MERQKATVSDLTTINSTKNNNFHHQQAVKRMGKQQQVASLSPVDKPQVKSVSIMNSNTNHQQSSKKNSLSWKKRWAKWLSSCSSEQSSNIKFKPIVVPTKKQDRTRSENDLSKRVNIDHDEQKNLSSLVISPTPNDSQERNSSKTSSNQHRHHRQSIDKVNNSNSVIFRDRSYHYSNQYFSSIRIGEEGQHQSQTSIPAISLTTNISPRTNRKQQLSRSADRLNSKSTRREFCHDEHSDYIPPPPPPLNSIQCHPTSDHYARTLNQSSYFYSTHRRSQIEVYQLSSPNNRCALPRPYSSNIPIDYYPTLTSDIPIIYNSPKDKILTMSKSANENYNTYGRLSDCHSPLAPVENSSIKAPRRIETAYSQFPLIQQEPIYTNTQSLYDNILYPPPSTPTTTITTANNSNPIIQRQTEKKSCASQTQLTWTMATFSSFVDLENQSIIIQQPDPSTLCSIVRNHCHDVTPSTSSTTIDYMKRTSPNLQYIDDTNSQSRYQRPRTPTPSKSIIIEKRDGSFQTLLTIAPSHDMDANRQILFHDSTPSPISTGSSSTTDHHHQHRHRHRKHRSRSSTNRHAVNTRDVGLQVNIQTVKKITFSSEKGDDSASVVTATSPSTVVTSREYKNAQTNTDPIAKKSDRGTSYEIDMHMVTSSSQTLESQIDLDRKARSVQIPAKSSRDQSIETNNKGLFVCDLSSFIRNGIEEPTTTYKTITATKRKP